MKVKCFTREEEVSKILGYSQLEKFEIGKTSNVHLKQINNDKFTLQ